MQITVPSEGTASSDEGSIAVMNSLTTVFALLLHHFHHHHVISHFDVDTDTCRNGYKPNTNKRVSLHHNRQATSDSIRRGSTYSC